MTAAGLPGDERPGPRFLDSGDAAFTIEFGDAIDPALLSRVSALDAAIDAAARRGALPGFVETMPTFRSLTVFYDPLQTSRRVLQAAVEPLLAAPVAGATDQVRYWQLPVWYGGDAGPDLPAMAGQLGISAGELVARHAATEFVVYMLGFLPGFPFMGDLPESLAMPRRSEPRVRIPAGSVAVAGRLSAIYPWESPGGWQLLGRCPVPLFAAGRAEPSLLRPGDRVRFQPIDEAAFRRLELRCRDGSDDAGCWRLPAPCPATEAGR